MLKRNTEAQMATKTCPSCGEEVPVAAGRCKSCFYDFNEEPEQNKSGMMGLLVLFAAMAMVGMGVFWYLHTQVAAERVVCLETSASMRASLDGRGFRAAASLAGLPDADAHYSFVSLLNVLDRSKCEAAFSRKTHRDRPS